MATWSEVNQTIAALESAIIAKNIEIDNLRTQLAAADPALIDQNLTTIKTRLTTAKTDVQNI
jgi:hypothetical protein